MHSPERQDPLGVELLRLARGSIEHGIRFDEPLPIDDAGLPVALAQLAATFTTLRHDGELRGCCGSLEAVRPLAADVAHSAFRAAFRDPRFAPLGRAELALVRLEVAVLSPLEPVIVSDETDLIDQLRPGVDGLVMQAGRHRATFLPKVWESFPEPRRFVAALKVKCGLADDDWPEHLEFQRYRTTAYAEPAQPDQSPAERTA
ncbi:MAG: AmmeMemoRadiSam system protein A [Woeseiaceae bacterium]|nr:AmmeMemoRadiSam system protein A [Woeseiaceae bacterium]